MGRDNRESSAELKAAFMEGVRAAGLDIVDIGEVTTPMLYFATAHWRLDGGANITGSHNPVDYNGVKMVHPGAAPLSEDEIQQLRHTIESGDFEAGQGAVTAREVRDDYFGVVTGLVRPARRLRVVVDAGNGVAGRYGPELLRRIGCDVVELYCESDGRFPNHLPDPEDPRTSSTCRPRSWRSAPTSAWRGTATPIASASSTSAVVVTRPIWSWPSSPATCCAGIPAPRSSST